MKTEEKDLQSKDIVLNSEVRDSGGKVIFESNVLCSQFIRDYVDLPCLKDVMPEDVEDVSSQFVSMFEEERNADRVKRVRIRGEDDLEPPFFLVSLIEHKTKVEYNVCMQIFRYMVYIWNAYEKEMEKKQKGISKRKDFRYPPILPIVYYEGQKEWIAPLDFKSRVSKSDIFEEYIPDFKYYLVPIQKYSNDELLSKEDEISLIMLINKMQTPEDVEAFGDEPDDKIVTILKDTPNYIVDIIADIFMAFQLKANVPLDIAETNVRRVREKNMAKLFENADFGDLFAKSQMVKEQRKQLAENEAQLAEQEAQLAEQEAQLAEQEAQLAEQEAQLAKQEVQLAGQREVIEKGIQIFIENMQECGAACDKVRDVLISKYGLSETEANEKLQKYWIS